MTYVRPSEAIELNFEGAPAGQVGTIGFTVYELPGGAVVKARTTAGITEVPAGSGTYYVNLIAPNKPGSYAVTWDTGVISPSTTATEILTVSALVPSPEEAGNIITLAQLRRAKGLEASDIDPGREAKYEDAIVAASQAVRDFADRSFGLPITEGIRIFEYEEGGYVDIDDATEVKEVQFIFGGITTPITSFYWRAEPQAGPPYTYLRIPHWAGVYSPEMGFTRNMDVLSKERGWPGLIPQIQVTAKWGWPTIPAPVATATILTALEIAEAPEPFVAESIAGYQYQTAVRSSSGSGSGTGAPSIIPSALPSRAQDLLMPYVRFNF